MNEYISELLYDYDCVIIPGFGGLVAQMQPATVNQVNRQMYPPSKKVAFNQNLKHNDGLLANHLCRRKNCSYAEALVMLNQFVQLLADTLQNSNSYALPGIGSFRLDAENKLLFFPEKNSFFLYDSYGLQAVKAVPADVEISRTRFLNKEDMAEETLPENREENDLPAEENAEEQTHTPVKKRRKKLGVPFVLVSSAVVVFSLLTVFLSSNNMQLPFMGGGDHQSSSFSNTSYVKTADSNEIGTATETESSTEATAEESSTSPAESSSSADNNSTKTEETTSSASPEKSEESPVSTGSGYYIIAGAFGQEENANKLLKDLKGKGFDALFAGRTENDLLRVAYLRATNRMEAERKLSEIRGSENSEAWILKK